MSAVEINNISCSIGSSQVLVKASLKINHGSIYCLLGPSVRIFPNFIWKSSRSHICYFSNPFEKITFYFDSLILMCYNDKTTFLIISVKKINTYLSYRKVNDYESIIQFNFQGCGKTTICLSILKLNRISEGKITLFKDQNDIFIPGKDVGKYIHF